MDRLLAGVGARGLPRRDSVEVLGTRSALELVDDLAPRLEVELEQSVVREIHRRVLEGQSDLLAPGEYRRGENRVAGPNGEIIFTTPPSGDVPELMRDLVDWLRAHRELPSPILAALAHLEFVAIHAFNDGNGRTARAISRFFLVRGTYALDGLVSLDAHLDIHRSDYFGAIRTSIGRSYQPGYDATPFLVFFLGAIAVAADHVLTRLRGIGQVQITVRGTSLKAGCHHLCSMLSSSPSSIGACVRASTSNSLDAPRLRPRAISRLRHGLAISLGKGVRGTAGIDLARSSWRGRRPASQPIHATTWHAHRGAGRRAA